MAALGLAACDPAAPASSAPASNQPASSQPASSKPASSKPASSSKPVSSSAPVVPTPDATGHIWAADTDVAADTEAGTVAFKKAVTTTPATDKAVRYKVNQSVVTYPEGSERKADTPEGYTKLNGDGQSLTFKFKSDKLSRGKLYLFGVMDNYSSNTNQGLYYQGSPNVEVKVNNDVVDVSAWANHTYADYLEEGGEGGNSQEGYVPVGDVVLKEGVNEVSYKRVQTRNMLIKDFVFVVEEVQEWTTTNVAADATAGTIAYKKSVNNLDGRIKIEFAALDGTMAEGSTNKDGTPAGFLKLNSNGNSISYKFNIDANLDGQLYQRGKMDSYGSNKNTTYYSQTKGAKHGNFKATMNGSTVYYGDKKDVTYGSMLGENVDADNYSDVCDCLIGDAFVKNGENNFSFERVDSYNLAISEFVFIGRAASAHAALDETAVWKMDEISHWKEMPNDTFKWNRADNEWEADPDHPDEPATCVAPGKTYEKEKESGLTRSIDTEINPNAHAWVDGNVVQNQDGKDCINIECSHCHKTGVKIAMENTTDDIANLKDSGDATAGFKPKKTAEWGVKLVVPATGYYQLNWGFLCPQNGGEAMSRRSLEIKINGVVTPGTFDGTKTPNQLGMKTSGDPLDYTLIDAIQLEAGNVSISLKNADYRLLYKGFVTLVSVPAPTAAE